VQGRARVLNKDLREFIESLNSNKVKYLIVGGYAVGIEGEYRTWQKWITFSPRKRTHEILLYFPRSSFYFI